MKYPHLMLDLETLGQHSHAPIIQVGACAFNIATGEIGHTFRMIVKPDFRINPPDLSTVCWWLQQGEDARLSAAMAEHGNHQVVMIAALKEFIDAFCTEDFELWAMPPEFDVVILNNTIAAYGGKPFWKYNRTRCLRTLEALVGASSKDRVKALVPHDAGEDAKAQAATAISYWARSRLGAHAMRQG